jgi:NADH-quinone oxidoreductase subunit K
MSIELMLSSVSLLLATLSKVLGDASGSVMALLMIGVIASEAAIFLAMIVHLYRANRTIDSDSFHKLSEGEQNA